MAQIIVKAPKMNSALSKETDIIRRLQSLSDEIGQVQRSLSFSVKSRAQIDAQMAVLKRASESNANKVSRLSSTLSDAINLYSATENRITNHPSDGKASKPGSNGSKTTLEDLSKLAKLIKDLFENLPSDPWVQFLMLQAILTIIAPIYIMSPSESVWTKFWGGDLELKKEGFLFGSVSKDGQSYLKALAGSVSLSEIAKFGYDKDDGFSKAINDLREKQGKDTLFPEQEKKYGKQINKDEKFYKERGKIVEFGAEAKAEGSVAEGKLSGSSKYAEGSLEGKFVTGEAHANASAGLYVYEKDANGNVKRIFSPGVKAEVGASASVLDVTAKGRVGLGGDKNMLGVYGEVNGKALSAEAKAKAAFNKNEAFVGASAEADLVKATAKGGVSVLGTDVGVTGSVKVGIGAHANAGYTDGKLKVDVGAAVGVGVDVGFEIDVGGTVKAVAETAEAAWNGVTGFFGGLFK